MNIPDEVKQAASSIILKAEIAAVLGLVQALSETLKVEKIDGLTPMEYFVRQRRAQLLEEVRDLQHRSPELSSIIQTAADQKMD